MNNLIDPHEPLITGNDTNCFNVSTQSISDLSKSIQNDIAYLREELGIISEENERKIVLDVERFFSEDIAREVRI